MFWNHLPVIICFNSFAEFCKQSKIFNIRKQFCVLINLKRYVHKITFSTTEFFFLFFTTWVCSRMIVFHWIWNRRKSFFIFSMLKVSDSQQSIYFLKEKNILILSNMNNVLVRTKANWKDNIALLNLPSSFMLIQ